MSISTKDHTSFSEAIISQDLLMDSIDWIKSNLQPEDVFDKADLTQWAIENDYVKYENA